MIPPTTASAIDASENLVNSVSRSQLPNYFERPGHESGALPESAAGQGRQFYYGADEQSLTVKSKDFDDVYNVSGQSQILKQLEQSQQRPMTGETGKKLTFGRGERDENSELGSSHVMIDDSTGSMVNMAISLDPLSAD